MSGLPEERLNDLDNNRVADIKRLIRIADIFEPQARIIVAPLAMVCGFYLALRATPIAWLFFIAGIYLFWDYFRHNAVWLAFKQFRKGNIEQVRRLLRQVRRPALLSMKSRTYYHWLMGVVDVADNNLLSAKMHLLVAASSPQLSENDRCLVQCMLAEVAIESADWKVASEHLDLASKLPHHENIDHIINELAGKLKTAS